MIYIERGKTKVFSIPVVRKNNPSQNIDFTVNSPEGLTVIINPEESSSNPFLEVNITANGDAPLGPKLLLISGNPAPLNPINLNISVVDEVATTTQATTLSTTEQTTMPTYTTESSTQPTTESESVVVRLDLSENAYTRNVVAVAQAYTTSPRHVISKYRWIVDGMYWQETTNSTVDIPMSPRGMTHYVQVTAISSSGKEESASNSIYLADDTTWSTQTTGTTYTTQTTDTTPDPRLSSFVFLGVMGGLQTAVLPSQLADVSPKDVSANISFVSDWILPGGNSSISDSATLSTLPSIYPGDSQMLGGVAFTYNDFLNLNGQDVRFPVTSVQYNNINWIPNGSKNKIFTVDDRYYTQLSLNSLEAVIPWATLKAAFDRAPYGDSVYAPEPIRLTVELIYTATQTTATTQTTQTTQPIPSSVRIDGASGYVSMSFSNDNDSWTQWDYNGAGPIVGPSGLTVGTLNIPASWPDNASAQFSASLYREDSGDGMDFSASTSVSIGDRIVMRTQDNGSGGNYTSAVELASDTSILTGPVFRVGDLRKHTYFKISNKGLNKTYAIQGLNLILNLGVAG